MEGDKDTIGFTVDDQDQPLTCSSLSEPHAEGDKTLGTAPDGTTEPRTEEPAREVEHEHSQYRAVTALGIPDGGRTDTELTTMESSLEGVDDAKDQLDFDRSL